MAGIDPATDPIPVRPAVHYHMGGIAVDIEGRSTRGRPVGLRRSRPHRAARRQPARQQFADGSDRLRAMGGGKRPGREPRPAESARGRRACRPHPILRPCGRSCRRASACSATGMASNARSAACYPLASGHSAAADPALVGLMIAVAAWRREESRGGHFRSDFPDALPVGGAVIHLAGGRARHRARHR